MGTYRNHVIFTRFNFQLGGSTVGRRVSKNAVCCPREIHRELRTCLCTQETINALLYDNYIGLLSNDMRSPARVCL